MKIFKKIFYVPIFDFEIFFQIGDTPHQFLLDFIKWAKDNEIEGADEVNSVKEAWSIRGKTSGTVGIWLIQKSITSFVHEAVHASNFILKDVGIESDRDNDEMCAYLTDYLTSKYLNFMGKSDE